MKKLHLLLFLLLFNMSIKAQETYSFTLDEAIQYALENNFLFVEIIFFVNFRFYNRSSTISQNLYHDILK